jgi:hypothetical protein
MAANCRAFGGARSLSSLFGPCGVRRPGARWPYPFAHTQSRHALACRACRQATLAPRPKQLAGSLVEAHYGSLRIVGFFVEVQELFHPPHELLGVVLGWDHPLLDQVRLEFVSLSVLRTPSHGRPSPRCPVVPPLCPPAASKTRAIAPWWRFGAGQGDQVRFGTPLQRERL